MSRAARLGAFIIATLAILAIGIFIIGDRQYLFSNTYQLKTQFANVVGLNEGAEVRVGGVHSGTVRRIQLPKNPTDKITVLRDLQRSTHDIIKQDSVAAIQTEGLLGNEYVSITFGGAQALNVRDGDTIGALVNNKEMYTDLQATTVGLKDATVHAQAGIADFQENMEALKQNFLLRGYFKKRGYEDSAELAKNQIPNLPDAGPMKTFTYDPKTLFEKIDTAKLKNEGSLSAAGKFLAGNEFGVAVVVVSTGLAGDTEKDLVLTQARAAVIRAYLVGNYGFDDSQLRILGMGKKVSAAADAASITATAAPAPTKAAAAVSAWGEIQIIIYPPGTELPADQQPGVASTLHQ